MPISIREVRSSQPDRDWIERSYREYLGDLSAGHTGVFPSLTVTGHSVRELLAGWYRDERSVPFVILREQEPAGFALVQRELATRPGTAPQFRLSEFFVSEQYRRRGVGRGAALLLFARYAGDWVVAEQARNAGSVQFWRRVIGEFTGGDFREHAAHGEVRHTFSSGPFRRAGAR